MLYIRLLKIALDCMQSSSITRLLYLKNVEKLFNHVSRAAIRAIRLDWSIRLSKNGMIWIESISTGWWTQCRIGWTNVGLAVDYTLDTDVAPQILYTAINQALRLSLCCRALVKAAYKSWWWGFAKGFEVSNDFFTPPSFTCESPSQTKKHLTTSGQHNAHLAKHHHHWNSRRGKDDSLRAACIKHWPHPSQCQQGCEGARLRGWLWWWT